MMVTINNGENFLHGLLSRAPSNKISKVQIYTTLIEQLRDGETRDLICDEIRHQSADFTAQLCGDVGADNTDVAMAALQTLGVCLHDEVIIKAFTEADCLRTLNTTCQVITTTADKNICTRALWCLSSQTMTGDLLKNEVESIISAIECALCTKNFQSMTVEHGGLNAIIRLLQQTPAEMSPLAPRWAKLMYPLLLHEAAKVRERAVVAMDLGMQLILDNQQSVSKSLMGDLKNKDSTQSLLLGQLTKLMTSKQEVFALRVWEYYIKILGRLLHHGQLINQLLPFVEQGFKNPAPEVKCAAYHAWRGLINNFALNPDILCDAKRVKLVMQVFKLSNAKVESVAVEKLGAWWFFLRKLGTRAPTFFDAVVVPLLNYCVGGIVATSKSQLPGSAQRTPTMSRLGLISSPTPPNTPGSPMPQFRCIHLGGAQVLGRILGSPLEDPSVPAAKFTLEALEVDLIATPAMFVKHAGILISAVRECFCNLQDVLHEGLLYHIWYSLVAHVKNVLDHANKKDAAEVLSLFLTTLQHLVVSQSLPPPKLLKLLQAVLCLPSRALSSSSYAIGTSQTGMMQGTPVLFLLDLLFNHRMLETSSDQERFFTIFEKLVLCGMSDVGGALSFMKAVLQLVEVAAPKIDQRESIWRMWSLMVNPLLEHILKTNEVNAGDALEHDFSCMYTALQLPIVHLLSSEFSVHALRSMLRTWTELYTTVVRLAALVTNVEANVCFEELSSRIVAVLDNNRDKFKDMACIDTVTQVCQVMVGQVDFSGVKSGNSQFTTSGLLSPGKFTIKKKPRTLGNLHSFVKVVAMVTEGLHHTADLTLKDTKSASGPSLQIAAIAIIDVLTTLITHLPTSGVVASALEKLAPSAGLFYEGSARRPTNKMYSQQVVTKLEKLWLDIVTCIQARYQGQYDSDFLAHLTPLLTPTFLHPRRPIRNQTSILWNATFSSSAALAYPPPLKTVLVKVREKMSISLPGWDVTPITLVEETQVSQISQGIESQVELPNIAGLTSPHKAVGSFMNKVASPDVKKSPLKRGRPPSVTSSACKKLGLDDLNSQDFVVITPTTRRTRLLTTHQREMLQERKVLPAMYNNLDASQDRSLMSQLSTSSLDTPPTTMSQIPFSFSAANKSTDPVTEEKAQESEMSAVEPEVSIKQEKPPKPTAKRRSVTFAPSPAKGKKTKVAVLSKPVDEPPFMAPMVLFGKTVEETVSHKFKKDTIEQVDVIPESECTQLSSTKDDMSQVNELHSETEPSEAPTQDSVMILQQKCKHLGKSLKSPSSSAGSQSEGSDAEDFGRETRERRKSPRKQPTPKKPKAEGMKKLETWFSPSKKLVGSAPVLVEDTQQFSPSNLNVLAGVRHESEVTNPTAVVAETPSKEEGEHTNASNKELAKAKKHLFEKKPVTLVDDSEVVSQFTDTEVGTSSYATKVSGDTIPDSEQVNSYLFFKPVMQMDRLTDKDIKQHSPKKNLTGSSIEASFDDGVKKVTTEPTGTAVVRKIRRRASFKFSKASQEKPRPISPMNMDDIIPSSQDSFGMEMRSPGKVVELSLLEDNSDSVILIPQTEQEDVTDCIDETMDVEMDEAIVPLASAITGVQAVGVARVTPVIVDMGKDSTSSSSENTNAIHNPDIIPADLSTTDSLQDSQSTLIGHGKRRRSPMKAKLSNSDDSIIESSQNLSSVGMLDKFIQDSTPVKSRPVRRRSMPSKFNDSEVYITPEKGRKKENTLNLRPVETLTDLSHASVSNASIEVNSSNSQDSNIKVKKTKGKKISKEIKLEEGVTEIEEVETKMMSGKKKRKMRKDLEQLKSKTHEDDEIKIHTGIKDKEVEEITEFDSEIQTKAGDKKIKKKQKVRRKLQETPAESEIGAQGEEDETQTTSKKEKKVKKQRATKKKSLTKSKEAEATKLVQNIVSKECNLDVDSDADDDVPITLLSKKFPRKPVVKDDDDDTPLSLLKQPTVACVTVVKEELSEATMEETDNSEPVLTEASCDAMSEDLFENTETLTSTPYNVKRRKPYRKRELNLGIDMVTSPVNKQLRSKGKVKLNRSLSSLQKRKRSLGCVFMKRKRSQSVAPAKRRLRAKVVPEIADSDEQIKLMKGTEFSSSEGSQHILAPTKEEKQSPSPSKEPQRQSPRKQSPTKTMPASPRRSPRKLHEESPQKYSLSRTRRSLNQSLELPETPTSGTKHQSRASLILERSRLFAPSTIVLNTKKKFTALKPATVSAGMKDLSPSKSILKPTLVKTTDVESGSAPEISETQSSPPASTRLLSASSPSFRPVQIPCIYSPSASPSAGILKKRKLDAMVATDSPSPPNKQRRVSFNDAVDVCQLMGKDSARPVNRCLDMPVKAARLTSPLVACTVTSNQSKFLTTPNQETTDAEKDCAGFAVPHPVNKKSHLSIVVAEPSPNSIRSTAESQLNAEDPIFPELQMCSEPIDQILPQLTSSTWIRGLGQLIRSKNIRTVGDLCALTEYDVNNLPIRTPKVATVHQVLEAYSTQLQQRKPKVAATDSKEQPTDDDLSEADSCCDTSKVAVSPFSEPLPSMEEALEMSPIREVDTSIESMSEMHLDLKADTTPITSNDTHASKSCTPADPDPSSMELVSQPGNTLTEQEFFREPLGTADSAESQTQDRLQPSISVTPPDKINVHIPSPAGDTKEKGSSRRLLKDMEAMAKKLTPEVLDQMPPSYLVAMHMHLNTMMTNVIAVQSNQCPLSPGSQLSQSQQ